MLLQVLRGQRLIGGDRFIEFGGYFFVWHSHAEKELTTFDIFPGGSLGAVVVLPPGTPIE